MDGTALVLCEGAFGSPSGKTAHGLVRHTERYRVLGVIDSAQAGKDAGEVLEGTPKGIPIFRDLQEASDRLPEKPRYLVIGLAPDGGRLPEACRPIVAAALRAGLHVDSGLHEFLGEDPEFAALADAAGVTIRDIRKPPPRQSLHFFSGKISEVKAIRLAVLGTDSAVGKRTTCLMLTHALNTRGLRAVMVGTGQTAVLQGVKYSIVLDSLVNDFVSGEIEHIVCQAWEAERPDVILLEGQGSITNPAYPGGFELIAAGRPHGLILQHAPRRSHYDGFPDSPMGDLLREIAILEHLSNVRVLALAMNHEGMTRGEIPVELAALAQRAGRPAFDVLAEGADGLAAALLEAFPALKPGGTRG